MKKELGIKISGRVIHGDHFGKVLGFPTANLDRRMYVRQRFKIKFGVYAGRAILPFRPERSGAEKFIKGRFLAGARDGKIYKAAIVIGPLDKHLLPKIEAHLLSYSGNLYGKKLIIILQKYLRPFRKFKNQAELQRQILKDIKRIKKL